MAYTYQDQLEFAASLYCTARMYSERIGCSWELIIAQACQECGWGEKCLEGTNNIYNIKADPSWKGTSKKFFVREEIRGVDQKVWADFRVYGSYAESLADRMRFLEQNRRYRDLLKPGIKGDYRKEAWEMQNSGYATDSGYATAIINVIETQTFRRAMAVAMKRGCGPSLPAIDIRVLDGANVPIPRARLAIQMDGKKVEAEASKDGRLVVRHKLPCGDLHLKIFDEAHKDWVDLEPVKTETTTAGQSVTLVAPHFVARTSTREHEKKAPPSPAPAASAPGSAPAAPKPAPAASTPAPAPAAPKPAPAAAKPPQASATAPTAPAKPTAPAATTAGSSPTQYKMHPVEKGQSLSKIGIIHGVSYQAIAKANGITSPFIIRPGQILKIPVVPKQAADSGSHAAPAQAQHPAAPAQHPAAPAAPAKHPATATAPAAPAHRPAAAMAPAAPAGRPAASASPEKHAAEPAPMQPTALPPTVSQAIKEGRPELHTVYMRNEKDNPQTDLMHSSRAPWLVHAQREFEKGVYRRKGKANDARILEYFQATKGTASIKTDEKAYCAAFANWCLAQEKFTGIKDGWALNFKKWGRPTRDNKPALGAVAVIEFDDGGHHVTFVVGINASKTRISTLGGNQGKAHGVTHSYCSVRNVIAYRYPSNYPHYDDDYVLHDVAGDNAPMTSASTH